MYMRVYMCTANLYICMANQSRHQNITFIYVISLYWSAVRLQSLQSLLPKFVCIWHERIALSAIRKNIYGLYGLCWTGLMHSRHISEYSMSHIVFHHLILFNTERATKWIHVTWHGILTSGWLAGSHYQFYFIVFISMWNTCPILSRKYFYAPRRHCIIHLITDKLFYVYWQFVCRLSC